MLTITRVLFLPLMVSALRIQKWSNSDSDSLAFTCGDNPYWGVFVDGRDASKGMNFYGEEFRMGADKVLREVYQEAKKGAEPGMELFLLIAKLYGEEYVETNKPHQSHAVLKCLRESLNQEEREAILEDIIVWNKDLSVANATKKEHTTMIFEEYNKKQQTANGHDEKLKALAFLMHNLAFDHALQDHNGRSREAILQYELRRLNLACGTLLFNNNRDMQFNTPAQTVQKLQEGIDMYNMWEGTKQNPWTDENIKKHEAAFPVKPELLTCFAEKYQAKKCGREGCNHAGTSVG